MKTKQEQIAEMAKERNEMKDIMKLLDKCVSLNPMYKSEVASVLYGNNYRKLPEDSVVLSREEYEMLKGLYDTQKGAIMTSSVGDLPLQEQIAEMAVIGCVRNPQAHTAGECAKCDFKQGQCNAYKHAEALYNAGYRKIPENAVVLTKEEYIDLSRNYVTEQIEKARKETAKEILSRIKLYATGSKTDLIVLIDEIAKANGVEVNE